MFGAYLELGAWSLVFYRSGDGFQFIPIEGLKCFRPNIARGGELRQAAEHGLFLSAEDEHAIATANCPELRFDSDTRLLGMLLESERTSRADLEIMSALFRESKETDVSSHNVILSWFGGCL
jgi:hypothetical protein